jgi:hypothetical protein
MIMMKPILVFAAILASMVSARYCQWNLHGKPDEWSVNVSSCPRLKPEGFQDHLQCLKGRNIVFIGDSITRYQYLSLVGEFASFTTG